MLQACWSVPQVRITTQLYPSWTRRLSELPKPLLSMHEDLWHSVDWRLHLDEYSESESVNEDLIAAALSPCPMCDENIDVIFSNKDCIRSSVARLTFKCRNGGCGVGIFNMDVSKPHSEPWLSHLCVVDTVLINKSIMRWNSRQTVIPTFEQRVKSFIHLINSRAKIRDNIHKDLVPKTVSRP